MEPTVIVKNANGPVLMNRSDYNADEHGEIFASLEDAMSGTPMQVPQTAIPPLVVPAQPAAIDANGNPVNPGDSGQFVPPSNVTLREDGPTVEEYVQAGYDPKNYPPQGYASRSTPEEIAAAIGKAAPPAPVQMAVTKKGKKFIVVDTAGNVIERDGIEKDGYASDTEAWAAITALSIPQA